MVVQDQITFGSGSGSHLPDSLKFMKGKQEEHNQNCRILLSHWIVFDFLWNCVLVLVYLNTALGFKNMQIVAATLNKASHFPYLIFHAMVSPIKRKLSELILQPRSDPSSWTICHCVIVFFIICKCKKMVLKTMLHIKRTWTLYLYCFREQLIK